MGGMPTSGERDVVTLLSKPMDHEGWAAEEVSLALLPTGDLALTSRAGGRVVQIFAGDHVSEYQRTWTVAAEQVDRVRQACVHALFPDQAALNAWLARTGLGATPGEWHGFSVRPVDDRRFLLEALRTIIGVTADDEGTTIAGRFERWLTGNDISYELHEDVRVD